MADPSPPSRHPLEAVLYSGHHPLARCALSPGDFLIGHERRNEIVVEEPSISGQHARLTFESEAAIFIEDLNSANGTLVDGTPAPGRTALSLRSEVHLGRVTLRFERAGLPASVFEQLPPAFLQPQRYEIGEAVVEGSSSIIYQARDATLGREVALRVMRPEAQRDPAAVFRFLREAQITAQLAHSGVLPIFELGRNDEGCLFFATRFVEGESLATRLERLAAENTAPAEPGTLTALLEVWLKVCDTIGFAHARGVVHNALTPDVIELGRHGEVVISHWHFARVPAENFGTQETVTAGDTALPPPLSACSAPEQAAGLMHDVDARTDLFGLGALLYQILTLTPPLTGEGDALLEAALNAKIVPPAELPLEAPRPHWPHGRLPEFPAALAMQAMSYAREDRPQSVAELQQPLRGWIDSQLGSNDSGSVWKQVADFLRPH